ncbi:hypothetical protein CGZ69_01735 [Streptomyces peucetius subsp. caesius ATCC 27952]|nr:hypothetical protein CGZ69_01735 [Streptomyces peucetius subsp. caesius ATCC 27952]
MRHLGPLPRRAVPENAAGLGVHQRAGFRITGTRERIGRQYGMSWDVVLLERRGPRISRPCSRCRG